MKGLLATCQESSGKALGNQRPDNTVSAWIVNERLHDKVNYADSAYCRPLSRPRRRFGCAVCYRLEASTKPKVDSRLLRPIHDH